MNRRSVLCRLTALGGVGLAGCLDRSGPAGQATAQVATDSTDGTAGESGTNTADGDDGTADTTETTAANDESGGSPADSSNWPTFGADSGHTGFRPEGVGPASGTVAWSAIGDAPTVLCSPTVKDGVVYTGSAANEVHAFDAETGDSAWTFSTTSYVETAPTVRDGRIYTADADGVVYALTTDGEEVWRHETEQNLHSRALAVRDETVYVGTAGDMPAVASGDTDKSKAGTVVALDTGSGDEEWSFEGPEDWFSGPALGEGHVYVGNHTGEVFALDADAGEKAWSWPANGVDNASILTPPACTDGTVYVGVHGAGLAVALDAETGAEQWRTDLAAENVKSSPAVTDERAYVGASRIRAVVPDAGTDEPGTNGTDTESTGTPTPESGTTGKFYALDRADGSEEWVHETDHDFRSSPAVVGDRVYVGGGDGALAVSRNDGAEKWRVTFDDFVDSSPAVAAGRLFLGSADGHLYCVADG